MVEKFNKKLTIYYSRNRFVNVRKRVIIKLANDKFKVITHYIQNGVYKTFVFQALMFVYYIRQNIHIIQQINIIN